MQPFWGPRAYPLHADRQLGLYQPIASEDELRGAIDAALHDGRGAALGLVESFALSAPVTIPAECRGLSITGVRGAPLYLDEDMAAVFVVDAPEVVLSGISVKSTRGRAGSFILDGTSAADDVVIEGCLVRSAADAFVVTALTGALAPDRWQLRGNYYFNEGAGGFVVDVAQGSSWLLDGNHLDGSVRFAAGSHERILGNNLIGFDIDLAGTDGGSVVRVNADVGTVTGSADPSFPESIGDNT